MFDTGVLGVDPGIATLGLAFVGRASGGRSTLVWSDTVRTPANLEEPRRLRMIADAVRAAIAVHRPVAVAVERVAWNRNASSAMAVARATGVILLAAAEAEVPAREYGPLEVKMSVTGVGNAPKAQVRDALAGAHGLRGVPRQPDAADAVAIAVCHLAQSRTHEAVARAGAG
jgi:crossover junction endodeoxyribonuclease RuvC